MPRVRLDNAPNVDDDDTARAGGFRQATNIIDHPLLACVHGRARFRFMEDHVSFADREQVVRAKLNYHFSIPLQAKY